jgi:radical SAM superfamily enzyme YgiQ (UPF0313 family)
MKLEKIALIQPPDPEGMAVIRDHMGRFGVMGKKTSIIRNDIFPPLDLAYSASLLEKEGFEVSITDSPALNLDWPGIQKVVKSKNPDLIFVNTCGITIAEDLDLASWLKNILGIETIAIVPVYAPEEILKEKGIEVFIHGEAEYTVLEICKKYPDIRNIDGLSYKKDGNIVYNPKRPLIKDLDELPFPAYHLLPMKKYSNHMLGRNFTLALTSRGCPFGCAYCMYPMGYGDLWRGRSPQNVVEELKMLKEEYKVKGVLFRDQVFNFNPQRTEDICDGIVKEGLDIRWRCECRVDLFTKTVLEKMKLAGCAGIHMGIESGDMKILKSVAKGCISDNHIDKIKEVFSYSKSIGLETLAFFMIGFPGETKESILKTFELAREIKANRAWFGAVVPYPGTRLYEIAEKNGWLLTKDTRKYTGRDVVMRTDLLAEEDIRAAVDAGNAMFSKDNAQFLKTAFSSQGIKTALLDPKRAFKIATERLIGRAMR